MPRQPKEPAYYREELRKCAAKKQAAQFDAALAECDVLDAQDIIEKCWRRERALRGKLKAARRAAKA